MPASKDSHRSINVLLAISSLEYGGAERQLVELCNNFDRKIVTPHIVTFSRENPLISGLSCKDIKISVIERRFKYDLSPVYFLSKYIEENKIDLIHAFLLDAELFCRIASIFHRRVKVIGSERNSGHNLSFIQKSIQKLTLPFVDSIIANSEAGKQYFARQFQYPSQNIHVIYNGVDTSRFTANKAKAELFRASLGIPQQAFVVGMIAKFKRQKRYEDYLQAAERILASRDDVYFLLVGDALNDNQQGSNEYHKEIRKMVDSMAQGKRCIFVNPRKDVEVVYSACDVTVLPSSREGVPNVLLESMSCQTPVIATNISDNNKIVKNDYCGYIVELSDVAGLADRISILADDREALSHLKKNARAWVEKNFSTMALAENTASEYFRVLGIKAISLAG